MIRARLVVCAGALVASFAGIAALGNLFDHARAFVGLFAVAGAAYGVAVRRVLQEPPAGRRAVLGIVGAAVLFRLCLWPTTPTLSTDLYRYVWDGRLAVAGVSPYRYPPNAPELHALRDAEVYPQLNHPDWRTIYPPGAQLLFAATVGLAPARPLAFKLLVGAGDLLTLGLVLAWLRALGRPPAWVLIYAWHPLVVVELAGSGHLDALALAASVAALWAATRGREGWAGALAGAGALVKLYPALLLPALVGRRPGRTLAAAGAVIAAGYAFYLRDGAAVLGSLSRYVAEEEFNGGLRAVLDVLLGPLGPAGLRAARLLPLAGLGVAALVIAWRGRAVPVWRRARWLIGGYLAAVPNLFPWYGLWIVPVLAVAPAWPWLWLTGAVALTYLILAEPVWQIPLWVSVVEFVPPALGLAWALGARAFRGPRIEDRVEVSS